MKRCWMCDTIKSDSDYYMSRSRSDGLDSICKPCRSQRDRERHARNRERNLERMSAYNPIYYQRHRDRLLPHNCQINKQRRLARRS